MRASKHSVAEEAARRSCDAKDDRLGRSAGEVWVRSEYTSARPGRACRAYRPNATRSHRQSFPTRRGSVRDNGNAETQICYTFLGRELTLRRSSVAWQALGGSTRRREHFCTFGAANHRTKAKHLARASWGVGPGLSSKHPDGPPCLALQRSMKDRRESVERQARLRRGSAGGASCALARGSSVDQGDARR